MPPSNWTPEGVNGFVVFVACYGVFALVLAVRRQYLIPVFGMGIFASAALAGQLAALVAVLTLILVCVAAGRSIDQANPVEWFVPAALGLAMLQMAVGGIAWIPVHYTALYWIACGAFLFWKREVFRDASAVLRPMPLSWPDYLAAQALGLVLACHLAVALQPEVSSDGLTWRKPDGKAAFTFVAFAAPPYVAAWIQTGNPVFPFANGFFQSPFFDTAQSFVETRFQEPLTWNLLYRLTFDSHLYFEGTDGAFGFQYLIAAPAVILALRRFGRLEAIAGAVITASVVGLAVSQRNLRYLYPVLPAATFLMGAAWRALAPQSRWIPVLVSAVLGVNLSYLPTSGWYHRDFATVPWRAESVAAYRERQAPARTLVEYLNLHYPGEPVIFVASGQTAFLRGRALVNSWHQYPFHARALQCRTGEDWKKLADSVGARFVIGLMAPAYTPEQQEFLDRHTKPINSVGDLRLFEINR